MRNRRNGAHTERASEAMNGQDSGGEQDYGDKRVERGGHQESLEKAQLSI